MLLLNDFRAYVSQCNEQIDEITKSYVVMDESQLNKFIESISIADGFVLMGIIPNHTAKGKQDWVQTINRTALILLKKVARDDMNHNKYLDHIQALQLVAKKLWDKVLLDNRNAGDDCNIMKNLQVDSLNIDPVGWLSGCDGYEIDLTL